MANARQIELDNLWLKQRVVELESALACAHAAHRELQESVRAIAREQCAPTVEEQTAQFLSDVRAATAAVLEGRPS